MCVEFFHLHFFQNSLCHIQTSPTLDLINDCFQFVTGFFEVINTSAPHIYHSALPLSPQTSIIRKLYRHHALPMARIIQGLPISWGPIVVAAEYQDDIGPAVWSQCSGFVAVARGHSRTIGVLDAVTLRQLHTFKSPPHKDNQLSFSPNSHLLMQLGDKWELTSWDLQTGGPVGTIPSEQLVRSKKCSFTYSMDGEMFAVVHGMRSGSTATAIISTYNLLSRTHTHSDHISKGCFVVPIWTCGACFQFVTVKPGSITIWEAGFTSPCTPAEIKSLPGPDNFDQSRESLFLPTLSLLAFILQGTVLVWDAQHSKFLLDFHNNNYPREMSFSSDGSFIAFRTTGQIHLWKDSPTGYIPHQTIVSFTSGVTKLLLSPNGKSIVAIDGPIIQLWRTADPITSPSSIPTQPAQQTNFILGFSPSRTLAAVARLDGDIATVLDLRSGYPQLVVNTGMKILGLRVTRSTVVVVGNGRVITWNLPEEGCTLNYSVNIDDSVCTTITSCSPLPGPILPCTSISPNLNYISTVHQDLCIYSMSTGEYLTGTTTPNQGYIPWFTQDECEIWCDIYGEGARGWSIVKDKKSSSTKLKPLGPTAYPSGGFPWQSPCNYRVTSDGWVLSPSRKRLLWLPSQWRTKEIYRMWGGQFLGLLHSELPEAVILELDK